MTDRIARVHELACLELRWRMPVHTLACFAHAALDLLATLPIDQPAVEAQGAGDLVGHQARDLLAHALQVVRLGHKPVDAPALHLPPHPRGYLPRERKDRYLA